MPIQVLPPQLANQIAAGEVVERPASVVKELVENSLDAGATRIDIDIERAGAKLIRIRDNGCGISREDLALALARHATSKIATLDDLEAILSLGFRGEALASISSVSRLTLTSRTEAQSEAWQAYAEGRDMAVTLKPAAHPVGSTVEVLDLFYNTPARRKFMRTEKTEFTHIDEVVRRIALARFDVTFTLTHNGKQVRQYRAVTQEQQHLRRLGSLCGPAFVQRALAVSWRHGDMAIRGWVLAPNAGDALPEMQYCYVNQRMMRDKLINHAIRQAYQELLPEGRQPAFVLYLDVDPHQVDVNVHPAKHEVRFHQARLVHDFIYQAVIEVLQHSGEPALPSVDQQSPAARWSPENRAASGKNSLAAPAVTERGGEDARRPGPSVGEAARGESSRREGVSAGGYPPRQPTGDSHEQAAGAGRSQMGSSSYGQGAGSHHGQAGGVSRGQAREQGPGYQKKQGELYRQLVQAAPPAAGHAAQAEGATQDTHSFGRVLTLYQPCYALVERRQRLALISLPMAERCLKQRQLIPPDEGLRAQPLLIPLRMTLKASEAAAFQQHEPLLSAMGIQMQLSHHQAVLNGVPLPLRQQNLQNLIPELLGYLADVEALSAEEIAAWIAERLAGERPEWSLSQAIQLLAEVERLSPQWVDNPPAGLMVTLDLNAAIGALNND